MASDAYTRIIVKIRCGKILCSRPIDRSWGKRGCSLGQPGGFCSAFKQDREQGDGDWKRLPECVKAETIFKTLLK